MKGKNNMPEDVKEKKVISIIEAKFEQNRALSQIFSTTKIERAVLDKDSLKIFFSLLIVYLILIIPLGILSLNFSLAIYTNNINY